LSQTTAVQRDESGKISKVRYDDYEAQAPPKEPWETANPVNTATGLLYDEPSKTDSNDTAAKDTDWYELFQRYMRHGYSSSLSGSSLTDHPVLLADRSYDPPAQRQVLTELLFEGCGAPAAFLARDAALQCYGCGRTTAVTVDAGHSGTTVAPVYDGYVELAGLRRSPVGVAAMDRHLLKYLDKAYQTRKKQKGVNQLKPLYQTRLDPHAKLHAKSIHLQARLRVAQECREVGAGAALNTSGAAFTAPSKAFTLPDGTVLDVPSATRFQVADMLYGGEAGAAALRQQLFEETQRRIRGYVGMEEVEEDSAQEDVVAAVSAATSTSFKRLRKGKGAASASPVSALTNKALETLVSEQLTSSNVAAMICDAAYRCERDQQAALLGNVVIGGGGACLGPTEQAVPDFVKESVEAMIHQHTAGWRVKVLSPSSFAERKLLTWLGGSILGSLGSFHEMYMTKAEYDEWGSSLVHRKCP
jgi:actin-related protein